MDALDINYITKLQRALDAAYTDCDNKKVKMTMLGSLFQLLILFLALLSRISICLLLV